MKGKTLPRHIENIHIYLWLMKDACWAAHWVIPGLIMILPTLGAAIWLLIRSKGDRTELVHNTAVLCWISANAIWMCAEFFNRETEWKPFSFLLFGTGILILTIYYLKRTIKKNNI